jgi:serine acetyltransferase
VRIGSRNVIGAGAIIMHDTEDEAVYVPERTQAKKIKSSALKGI